MDAEGNVVHKQRERSVSGFRSAAAALPVIADLEKRIAAGEEGLDYEYLMARWGLGRVEYEEIKEVAAKLEDLNEEQETRLAAVLIDAEVDHLIGTTRVRDVEARNEATRAAAPRLIEIVASDHPLSESREGMVWNVLLSHAETEGDVELFTRAAAWYKKRYADDPRAARFLGTLDERLEKLKEKGDG